jgi:putative membrane protein
MANNQGLYNGFLAAGLIWSAVQPVRWVSRQLQSFFPSCVLVTGIYGAATVNKRNLFIQALPVTASLCPVLLDV